MKTGYLAINGFSIALCSEHNGIWSYWRHLFGHLLTAEPQSEPIATMRYSITLELPEPAQSEPYFVDSADPNLGVLAAYQDERGTTLHFYDGANVLLPADWMTASHPVITGVITPNVFTYARFEDVMFVALAPLLRRHEGYLVHSSAVAKDEGAIIFVGQSHSGKTTTAINLALRGWSLLSNDIVMLRNSPADEVLAAPMPDGIRIRPKTMELLPQLSAYPIGQQFWDVVQSPTDYLPVTRFNENKWPAAAPVRAICFPMIADVERSTLTRSHAGVALAHLLEESVDMWDQETLAAHTNMLAKLTQQAAIYTLTLGPDLESMPQLLAPLLTSTVDSISA